jgi:diacylglycerol kinase (ATP)
VPLDLGLASGQWGDTHFVEGVGAGLIPAGITVMDANPIEEESRIAALAHAVRRYRKVLAQLKSRRYTVILDGTRTIGDFLLIEVLNIRSVGPNLVLAEEADSSDGAFTVVMAGEEHREHIARYLQDRTEQRSATLSLITHSARRVEIHGCDDLHVDDEVVRCPSVGNVSMQIEPAAIQVLV